MRKIILLLFLLSSFRLIAQNIVYQESSKKGYLKLGKFKYTGKYEYTFEPESRENVYSFLLIKDSKKQYIGHFVYQLKRNTERRISEDIPPPIQLENKIIKDFYYTVDEKKEQIVVTTYYYDEKEPKEKEIKTLQQSKTGFFYVKRKQIYFKNGEMKEEKDLPEKIEFVDVNF